MTTERIAHRPRWRTGASWQARASHLRRGQVHRAPEPAASGICPAVEKLWEGLVDVLRTIEAPSSALLCTSDGLPVMDYGLTRPDGASAQAATTFSARGHHGSTTVETLEVEAGDRQTVIASIPGADHGHLLLSVTAQAVSMPVLLAWTRSFADDLRQLLVAQP